jgi:hypothetical protein
MTFERCEKKGVLGKGNGSWSGMVVEMRGEKGGNWEWGTRIFITSPRGELHAR